LKITSSSTPINENTLAVGDIDVPHASTNYTETFDIGLSRGTLVSVQVA